MPKFTLTIETSDILDLRALLSVAAMATGEDEIPLPTGTALPASPPVAAAAPPARGRPSKAKAAASAPTGGNGGVSQTMAAFQASVDATDPDGANLPTLDVLKHAITTAVRLAQKGEGDPKILSHLPAFKTKTGLDFVMHATDDHRAALFELATKAGIALA
jgi:hypothetical protein